jgi:hypothetical protein
MSIWLSKEWSTPEYQAAKKLNFDLLDAELKKPPISILDIGCGLAWESRMFNDKYGTELWLLDGDTSLNTKQLLAVNGGTLQLNGAAITGGGGGTLPGGLVSTSYLENAILVSSIFNRSGVLNFSSLFVNSVPIVFDQYANLALSFQRYLLCLM